MRRVFTGGTVVAPDGTMSTADVAVEADRILDVGGDLDGDEAVDVSGKCLLPGLFDAHVHLAFGHIDLWRHVQTPLTYTFYQAIGSMRATLRSGITTVRDAGGADLGMKNAVRDGLVEGPRMQISINMISQTGGHGDKTHPSGMHVGFRCTYPGSPPAIVDGPEEMRRKVRELIREGADVIKVATSGGVLSPRDDPRHAHFQPDELDMLVSEATSAGRWVMAHAQAVNGIKNAVQAGVRSIEHGIYLDDEAIEMMLERGTWLVPTLVAPAGVLRAVEEGAQIPEESIRKAMEVTDVHRESFARAVAAGVKVAMGTDSPVTPHGENLEELILMQKGGMTAGDALHAATMSAAELLGMEHEVGSIEPGKYADLVVVDGDPLDFSALSDNIAQVWKAGHRVV